MKLLKSIFLRDIPFFISAPALIWQVLFLYAPLCFIIGLSIIDFSALGIPSLTLSNYTSVFNLIHLRILARSLLFALCSSVTCLLIAYPLAYFLAFRVRAWKTVLIFFVTLPFLINFLIHIYAWFFVLERNGVMNFVLLKLGLITDPLYMLNNQIVVWLVMVHCYLPFMVMPIFAILEKLDLRLIEASLDLGASPITTFFKVTIPLTLSGIKAGFFLVFVATFGEFSIPTLMGGGKELFVGTLITDYFLLAGNAAHGAAFTVMSSCALIGAALIMQLLAAVFFKQKGGA